MWQLLVGGYVNNMKWHYYITTILIALVGYSVVFPLSEQENVGGKVKEPTLEETIATLYAKYEDYIQVTPDGKLLVKDIEVTESILSSKLPVGTTINVYESPQGKGYQIVTETETQTIAVGYGANAQDYTYTIQKELKVASSTP